MIPSVFVYATVWGGLARQAGLALGEIALMLVIVTAGAAQFVAVPMIAAGAPPLAVILTTYVVNMRHYLMAATLAPAFSGLQPRLARPDRPRRQRRVVRPRGGAPEPARALVLPRQRRSRVRVLYRRGARGSATRRPRQRSGAVRPGLCVPRRVSGAGCRPAPPAGRLGGRGGRGAPGPRDRVALPRNWHIVVAGLVASGLGTLVMRPEEP